MTFNFKKALLAGSAIVAVGAVATQAQAAIVQQTLTASVEWATDANQNQSPADGTGAAAGDPVNLQTFTLTVVNDGVNNDGSGLNTFVLGAVTGTTGDLIITDGASANLTTTVASFNTTSTGDFSVTGNDANTANITATVTGGLTSGGALSVVNTETSTADVLTLNVGGALNVTGTTALTAGGFAGANSALTVTGNTTLTGAATVTAATAATTATLTLNGASNTFTGGLNLVTAARSILNVSGAGAQTVAGNITGAGNVNVTNDDGVTFTGTVAGGTITVDNSAALASSATFQNTVSATAITLGGGSAGANTVTFDGTTQAYNVASTVNGTGTAGENNTIRVIGGRTIGQNGIIGGGAGNIDLVAVSGTGTVLDSNAAITATNTTIASGSTLDVGAGLLTSPVANAGTLLLSGAGGVTGNVTGAGLLDVNASATVTGAITQGTADIGAFTLTQAGGTNAYNVGTTNFSGAGTLALAAGNKTVTGNFTNTTDGLGTITIADGVGTTTINGDLGAGTTHSLAALTVAGGTAQTVTTNGDLFVDATTINDADTLSFIGNDAQTVSGTITDGILDVGTGTSTTNVTFNGVLSSLASGNIDAGATARYNANATFTGGYTQNAAGTTSVAQGATVSAGSFSNAGSYALDVTDANGTLTAADFGRLTDSSPGSVIANNNLSFDVNGIIGTGTATSVLTGVTVGTSGAAISDNSFRYTFTANNAGGNTNITVATATNAELASDQNQGVAGALDGLTADPDFDGVTTSLATAGTEEEFNDTLESLGPTVDGGAIVSGYSTSIQSLDVVNSRVTNLRNGNESSMPGGLLGDGMGLWVKAFGQTAEQDERDGVDGYESDTGGVAVGIDTANLLQNGTVGVAFSYANSDVDSKNVNETEADVDSYQGTVYGAMDITDATYLTGSLGYAHNSIDQTRHDVGGGGTGTGPDANADYDSDQYIAYAEVGHAFPVAQNTTLTPFGLAHYQHISVDDYTEEGAGALNLDVDSNDLDIFELGVGAELAFDFEGNDGSRIRPALNVGYRHDLADDNVNATSTFTGGGASFDTEGLDPADGTFNAGLGVTYALTNNWEFAADYDYEVKSDYDAHSGYVRAGYKF